MNLLREVRRVKQKSMPVRILSLFVFAIMLIVSTFAWFASDKDVRLKGIEGDVTSWDVAYYVDDEDKTLDQTAVFTVDEFYPGMPQRTDYVHIYNLGESSTRIQYEIVSIKLFNIEIYETIRDNGEIVTEEDETSGIITQTIFSKDTDYPFTVSVSYDKTYLSGKYVDLATTPESAATFEFKVNWEYGEAGRADEISAKDLLDTTFGQQAYEYYEAGNDINTAMEITVRITSSMIHPSLDVGS